MLARLLNVLLHGHGAHVATATVFDGLDWRVSGERPPQAPYSVWQLLQHMIFWQDFLLAEVRGETPKGPAHAKGSWPGGDVPASEQAWQEAVAHFKAGLLAALQQTGTSLGDPLVSRPQRTRAEDLAALASHNSYHAGEVTLVRRQLGAWPPPTGGDTW